MIQTSSSSSSSNNCNYDDDNNDNNNDYIIIVVVDVFVFFYMELCSLNTLLSIYSFLRFWLGTEQTGEDKVCLRC